MSLALGPVHPLATEALRERQREYQRPRPSLLLGDSNGDRSVNSGDATQTRNRSGQALTATTFRSDVNVDATINSGDAFIVRSRSGQSIP